MYKVLGPARFHCNYSINDSFRKENPVKAVGPIRLHDFRVTLTPDGLRTKPAPTLSPTPHHPVHSFLLSFDPAQSFSGWLFGAGRVSWSCHLFHFSAAIGHSRVFADCACSPCRRICLHETTRHSHAITLKPCIYEFTSVYLPSPQKKKKITGAPEKPPRPGTELGLMMMAYEIKSSLKGCPVGPLAAILYSVQ